MTYYMRPSRVTDRVPDDRTYGDGWAAAKADSRHLLTIADALLRPRLTPDGVDVLDELVRLHDESREATS